MRTSQQLLLVVAHVTQRRHRTPGSAPGGRDWDSTCDVGRTAPAHRGARRMVREALPLLMLFTIAAPELVAQADRVCHYEDPAWSPDGSQLLFASTRGGNFDIYAIRPNASDLRQLTVDTASDAEGRWSPDGRSIVFVSGRPGPSKLYLMDQDGGSVRMVSSDIGREANAPAWSPDGRYLYYESRFGDNRDISRVGTAGTAPARLTLDPANDFRPAPSPDGGWIAFQSNRSGVYQLYRMPVAGGGIEQLTRHEAHSVSPSWSPDGGALVFMSLRDGTEEIYTLRLVDGSVDRLTSNSATDRAPRWSPDGRRIAFWSDRSGQPGIYVMGSDGSNPSVVIEGCDDAGN